jgi:hypothetical protein
MPLHEERIQQRCQDADDAEQNAENSEESENQRENEYDQEIGGHPLELAEDLTERERACHSIRHSQARERQGQKVIDGSADEQGETAEAHRDDSNR